MFMVHYVSIMKKGHNVQHQGFGKRLLKRAEDIVKLNNIKKS